MEDEKRKKVTTIQISKELREQLKLLGRKGETYEDIIHRLLDFWWARGDSNPGPPPCQGGVITSLDHGPARGWWTGRDLNPGPPPCQGGAHTRLSYRPTPI